MKYICVAITRDVVDYQSFGDRNQAVDYFYQNRGQDTLRDMEVLREKYEKRIENYKSKIWGLESKLQKLLALSTMTTLTCEEQQLLASASTLKPELEEKLKSCQERMESVREELEALKSELQKRPVTYEYQVKYKNKEAQIKEWDAVLEGMPTLMLHTAGIYQNGNTFNVIEEKFSFIGARRESSVGIWGVMKRLPKAFDKNRIYLYVVPETNESNFENMPKILTEMNRIRGQLQRNFANSPTRLKEWVEFDL